MDALVQSWRRPNPIAVRRCTKAARPELLPRSTRGVCPNEVRGFSFYSGAAEYEVTILSVP